MAAAATSAPVKSGRRNSERSSIGCRPRCSAATNPAINAAPSSSRPSGRPCPTAAALDQPGRQRRQPECEQRRSEYVDRPGPDGARFSQHRPAARGQRHGKRGREGVSRAPAGGGLQAEGEERADRHAGTERGTPDPRRPGPLTALRVGVADQAQTAGHDRGTTQALHDTGQDQQQRIRSSRSQQRARRENHGASQEHAPAPVVVPSAPLDSSPAAQPTLIPLKIHACAPGPACTPAAVAGSVAKGVVKATSTSKLPAAAIASVRPAARCSEVAAMRNTCSLILETAFGQRKRSPTTGFTSPMQRAERGGWEGLA